MFIYNSEAPYNISHEGYTWEFTFGREINSYQYENPCDYFEKSLFFKI
jgi:hypothetical protein